MTENSNTPTPENNSPNAQSYGSYGSQSGTSQNGGAYQQPYGAPTYGTPAGSPQQPGGKKPKNIVGIVALALSALGFVLGLFPATALFGWLLLFAGFVTGIVGLFQKLKEKITSIIAIVLSALGTIASIIAMVVFAANTIANDPEFEQMIQDAQTSVSAAGTPSASATSPSAAAETSPPAAQASTGTVETSSAVEPTSAEADNNAAADVPRQHTNALKEARSYLEFSSFSYAGLYDQLTSEYGGKYPAEAAQYAVDNLEVDWNAEALGSAENYLEFSAFSYEGLYDQLTSEYGGKFTPEQAQYAMDNL